MIAIILGLVYTMCAGGFLVALYSRPYKDNT